MTLSPDLVRVARLIDNILSKFEENILTLSQTSPAFYPYAVF